ncbi:MAG: hypothetical protein HOH33_09350 [Verrucomicrobia bacterium]|jgi:hypothetical protein|nr:hypothetical protein [Verrucomicrobiota bacterium]
MSTYQYYEFQAIDGRLTDHDMEDLRDYSSRARITSASFSNEYHYGSFKGDEDEWMDKYFDAFLYVANWGTRILKIRIPEKACNASIAENYMQGEMASVRKNGANLILDFRSEDEDSYEWVEGEGTLDGLIPVRDELNCGDLRALYLGWLLGVERGEFNDKEKEPDIPSGLANLSPALERLVDFLRLDKDLLAAAAESSAPLEQSEPDRKACLSWIAALKEPEKNGLLLRTMEGDRQVGLELKARFTRQSSTDGKSKSKPRRTVGKLRQLATEQAEKRRRAEEKQAKKEKARREKEKAAARKKHLDSLEGKEGRIWEKVYNLVEIRNAKSYDQAIGHLKDLRDLSIRKDKLEDFLSLLESLREPHMKKQSFIERLIVVDGSGEALVLTTRQLITKATAFDEKYRNHNFDYDMKAYEAIKDNFECLLKAGHLPDVMNLAVNLMQAGSAQIEASDEGMMLGEIEDCLKVAILAVRKSDLLKSEILDWTKKILAADRVRFICHYDLEELQRDIH